MASTILGLSHEMRSSLASWVRHRPSLLASWLRLSSGDPRTSFWASEASYRSDEIEFELKPAKVPGWRLEYKVGMKAGDALLYSLTSNAPVISEFHNEITSNKAVMFYREEQATTASHGQFIAPAAGAHGWYIANTTDEPVKVRLKLSGYYTTTPGLITIE